MVKVRHEYPIQPDGTVNLTDWSERIQKGTEIKDMSLILSACDLAYQAEKKSQDAKNAWSHLSSSFAAGLEMAEILADLRMDEVSIITAVLYRSVREGKLDLQIVEEKFGDVIRNLIEGVLRMAVISSMQHPTRNTVLGQSDDQVNNVRKMLVSVIDDVRVALVKLAERTCAIRAVKKAPELKRKRVAREVFDIYAPLAHRLGIGHIKWELEDLSFCYLEPVAYQRIAELLNERRLDRQEYISFVVSTLQNSLNAAGIKSEVNGRAKHIYSIWRKMRRKNIDFSQVYDIRAVRILVPEVRDCYAALGIVHAFWRHIPHEFDDYIANPKENGYRSLHTAVIGPEGKVLEVQIRTFEMHDDAELGVCAHWRYKGSDQSEHKSDSYEQKIAWLRQVLEWHDELGNDMELMDNLRRVVTPDRIYVLTPDGHVVDLQPGSTPVDFAYRVHTEIGHRCRGAKINGRVVPLTTIVKTGDQVEILTAKEGGPNRDWLNANLGYITTARARAKITQWFKKQALEQNIEDGKAILQPELERLSIHGIDYEKVTEALNYKTVDDLFAAVGAGDLLLDRVVSCALQFCTSDDSRGALLESLKESPAESRQDFTLDHVSILGAGNLEKHLAECCKPKPGDPIVGYIMPGRGVVIHVNGCSELNHLQEQDPNRMIQVEWRQESDEAQTIDIMVKAFDRTGLLRDITSILADAKVNVLAVNTLSDRSESTADMLLTLEISGYETLGRVLARINQLPNVVDVKRCVSP